MLYAAAKQTQPKVSVMGFLLVESCGKPGPTHQEKN